MPTEDETRLRAVDGIEEQLKNINLLAQKFGQTLSSSLVRAAVDGKDLETVLKNIGKSLIEFTARLALRPLEQTISRSVETLFSGTVKSSLPAGLDLSSLGEKIGGVFGAHANGNIFAGGRVRPFAAGGVVATPTFFPTRGGLGLMGEAGPEAIMPLARGPDGRLGVQAAGSGQRPVVVNVQIATNDAESFRRSEAQVSAALARAVARGQRAL